LHFPGKSKYNTRWGFKVTYDVVLNDNKSYEFETNFSFDLEKNEVFYDYMGNYTAFNEFDWSKSNCFLHNVTSYIGNNIKDISETQRGLFFVNWSNPGGFADDEFKANGNIFIEWWKKNNQKITDYILQNKNELNQKLLDSIITIN
jgi:hypothetical protein